jgi:hypothetical protein
VDRLPVDLPELRRLLARARRDPKAAGAEIERMPLDAQVALVCEAPPAERSRLLDLVPEPEKVIPLLPDAELVFTARAVGVEDASWLVEHATSEQLVAAFDLDAWRGTAPDPSALERWMAALAEAGEEALLRALQALDPELVVLWLAERAEVSLKPSEQDDPDWSPPIGAHTVEGQFFLQPRRMGDDLAPLLTALRALFQSDYWLYFRTMQGAIWELRSELESWALRWREGRLEELGFPAWEEAARIYAYVAPALRAALPAGEPAALDVDAFRLPVWMPELPVAPDSRHAIFRALGDLEEDERRAFFYAFVALSNRVAVADRMELADPETLPRAIEKAAATASLGLEHAARENGLAPADVLRRAPVEWLFRVGASLDPGVRPDLEDASDEESEETLPE